MALLDFIKKFVAEKEGTKEYREKLNSFLSDANLSDEEKDSLQETAKKFNLTNDELLKLQKSALSAVFNTISSDQRITEEEKESLEVLLNHFGIETKDISFDQKTFNKFYSLSLIEKGILPEIKKEDHDLNIIFRENEILHYGTMAIMRKLRRITHRIDYHGLTGSVKIVKGWRYRVGSINFNAASKEVLSEEDRGLFYITNLRIGYAGEKKQFSFTFSKIHSFELRPEGVFIFKEGKENPYILTLDDYEVPSAIVSHIMNKES